jgi:hypothetical protein
VHVASKLGEKRRYVDHTIGVHHLDDHERRNQSRSVGCVDLLSGVESGRTARVLTQNRRVLAPTPRRGCLRFLINSVYCGITA